LKRLAAIRFGVALWMRESSMTPLDKIADEKRDPSKLPDDDPRSKWAEEDREIEDRKPDLGEIEEDTSEL
jgi:hypothetical protein